MADGSSATPGSATGKTSASKDKECPYCHQAFTSSSLGRHLDLYIKEKNAKPPDDVHNVEEIRRMRGSTTRRQARTSSGRRDGSTPSSAKATPFREQRSPSIQKSHSGVSLPQSGPIRTFWNQANWQATGVINDLPTASRDEHIPHSRRRTPSRRGSVKEEISRRQHGLEERDRAQAAEIALKEVLENVRAAKYVTEEFALESLARANSSCRSSSRAHPSSPFDFNFFRLSLPEMYLQCLPSPPELLVESTIPQHSSWSIDAPSTADCEVLRGWLEGKLYDWRRRRDNLQFGNPSLQNGLNVNSPTHPNGESMNKEEALYYSHLADAHQEWTRLSEKERQKIWHIKCATAFAHEREKHENSKRALEQAEQEIQLLRAQLAQINNQQLTPEFAQYPTSILPLSREASSYLPPESSSWTFASIINKWKTRIQSSRSSQHPLPFSLWSSTTPTQNHTNGGGPYPHAHRGNQRPQDNENDVHSDEDQDLTDAPGEDDTVEEGHDGHPDRMNRGVLDPHLRDRGGGAVIDGQSLAGSRMLMELGTTTYHERDVVGKMDAGRG